MQTVIPFEPGHYYHIYDRGINRTNIFMEERNYAYFFQLYARYIAPVADTFAYCLLRNHFHLLVRIRAERAPAPQTDSVSKTEPVCAPTLDGRSVSHAFNNCLSAYTKAINNAYGRTGGLFQRHLGRLAVNSDRYFVALIHYIHYNPQKHGFVEDFRDWPYSSYHSLLSDKPTRLERAVVLDWFGGPQALRQIHSTPAEESFVCDLIGEDA